MMYVGRALRWSEQKEGGRWKLQTNIELLLGGAPVELG
jgi:hypothetical protein